MLRSEAATRGVLKGVLRNFTKFTGKHLCQSLFFNKVAGMRTPFLHLRATASVRLKKILCTLSRSRLVQTSYYYLS